MHEPPYCLFAFSFVFHEMQKVDCENTGYHNSVLFLIIKYMFKYKTKNANIRT